MHIKDKIMLDLDGLKKEGPITIVAFGDSVTHGSLIYDRKSYETVYWNVLRKMILRVRNYVPVNVIDAGIGGTAASNSLDRLDAHVLVHKPDLVIICFGLNDINGTLDEYLSALKIMFEKCKESGTDVIFMTPNMLNTYVDEETPKYLLDYAERMMECQNSGKMDLYMKSAMELAEKEGVTVCDCYSKWKELAKTRDTTKLLINRINHPIPEMHELFAQSLFEIIFKDMPEVIPESPSSMFGQR